MHTGGIRGGLMLLLTLASQTAMAQSEPPFLPPLSRTVITTKEAFVMEDLEKVVGASVSAIYPSPEGRYALIVQRAAAPAVVPSVTMPLTLFVWDSRTRRLRVLWQFEGATRQEIGDVKWFAGTSVALVDLPIFLSDAGKIQDRERAYHVIDLSRATVRRLDAEKPLGNSMSPLVTFTRISLSPTLPVAAVLELRNDETNHFSAYFPDKLRFVGTTGDLSAPVSVQEAGAFLERPAWSADGRNVYLKRDDKYFSVDSRRLALLPLSDKPDGTQLPDSKEISVNDTLRTARGEGSLTLGDTSRKLRSLWLEGDLNGPAPRALADADVDEDGVLTLLPDDSALLIQKNGVLYVLPLQKYNRESFLAHRQQALKEVTMQRARRILERLLSYSADHEGKIPSLDDPLTDALGRYGNAGVLKDPDTGKVGLVFPNPAFNFHGVDNPDSALVGYLPGPGGKAQMWGDGHVTWQDDPKNH